jgi:ABC-type antimicrobial peptide transport system permease subunit
MALLLTAVGIYGVLSYAVAQRRREIGVRMALGAHPTQIRSQFLSIGLRLFVAGVSMGLPAAWLAGRSMQSLLFNVPPLPAGVMLVAVALLGLVMGAACLVPSHRAARLSPMQALADD